MGIGQRPFEDLFPALPEGFTMPFWYASLQSLWLYWLVEPEQVRDRLPDLDGKDALEVALFEHDGRKWALASVDLQIYTGHGGQFLEAVHEVEVNVYAYPVVRAPGVPLLTVEQFLAGADQTKTLGGYRLHVPCDNPNAVEAGKGLFGEPKFLAQFDYDVPGPNNPEVRTWTYSVHQDAGGTKGPLIWRTTVDLTGLASDDGGPSPLIEYGVLTDASGERRVVANEWDFYGAFPTYALPASERRVEMTYGSHDDPSGTLADLRSLCGDRHPVAAQLFQSAPVSSESRGWYVVPR